MTEKKELKKLRSGKIQGTGFPQDRGGFSWRFIKRYFNKKDQEWKDTEYFFGGDLRDLKALVDQAIEAEQENKSEAKAMNTAETTEW